MKIARAFEVKPLNADRRFLAKVYSVEYKYEDVILDDGREIKRKVEGSGHLVSKDVETKGGFLVIFPNKNSIRVETQEQLKSLGLDIQGGFVDLDTGEEVPIQPDGSVDFRAMIANTAQSGPSAQNELDLLGERDTEELIDG